MYISCTQDVQQQAQQESSPNSCTFHDGESLSSGRWLVNVISVETEVLHFRAWILADCSPKQLCISISN